MNNYRLEMNHITKIFPGVKALDDVHLHIAPGSVHALVGENGAGKSTLMKCLFGIYKADAGSIFINGIETKIANTQEALDAGISMIHQELNVIPNRSITDNIWVGRYLKKGIAVDERQMYNKTKDLLNRLDFHLDPNALAKDLSVSELQAVEIAKAISYDAGIIIMDEPTSSLTIAETKHLFKLIANMRQEGRSIIYISHKMEEIFEITDEITVMRDGKFVGNFATRDVTIEKIINEMVGRDMTERFPPQIKKPADEIMLKIENFTSKNSKSFKNINFELYKGEILGIGGLVGAQRTELVESIFGLREIAKGKIYKAGKEITVSNPHDAISEGFALLTEERRKNGIIPMLSVFDNTLTASYQMFSEKILGIIRKNECTKAVNDVLKNMNVKMPGISAMIKNLSGGNQQKVLVGRWLLTQSNILILDEPTRGVDVGAKYEIYKIMRDLTEQGNSIIMVSSEMPELLGMSDRILVMCNGHLTGVLNNEEASQVAVMRLATQFMPQ